MNNSVLSSSMIQNNNQNMLNSSNNGLNGQNSQNSQPVNQNILQLEELYKGKSNQINEQSKQKLSLIYNMMMSCYEFLNGLESQLKEEKQLLDIFCSEEFNKDKYLIMTNSGSGIYQITNINIRWSVEK